jgi:hypothetical protein
MAAGVFTLVCFGRFMIGAWLRVPAAAIPHLLHRQ